MKKLLLLICFISPFSFAQEMVSEVVKVMDKEPHYVNSKHSRVTLLMPRAPYSLKTKLLDLVIYVNW